MADPIPIEGGALVDGDGSTQRHLFFLPYTGQVNLLWSDTFNRRLFDHRVDRTDSNALVWVDGSTSDPVEVDELELWTSPFATTRETLRPRRVAKLPRYRYNWIVANAGVVAFVDLDQQREIHIVRRSDGRGWRVPADPRFLYVKPVWVDETAVWVLASSTSESRFRNQRMDTIVRLDRASLGEPTEPNGL